MCARPFSKDRNIDLALTPMGECEKKRSDENDKRVNSRRFAVVKNEPFSGKASKLPASAALVSKWQTGCYDS